MRAHSCLLVLALVGCDRHKSECEALVKIDSAAPNAAAQVDAIGVRDAKLAPLASRYRTALVAEKTKRDAVFAAARDLLPGISLSVDAGPEASFEHVVADALPLIECLLERSTECDAVLAFVDTCSRPDPGVAVSAQLGVCAGALEAAKLVTPARITAAHDVASAIRTFAPHTATVTIDAEEAIKRFARAVPTARDWQSALEDRRASADDIRKACTPR